MPSASRASRRPLAGSAARAPGTSASAASSRLGDQAVPLSRGGGERGVGQVLAGPESGQHRSRGQPGEDQAAVAGHAGRSGQPPGARPGGADEQLPEVVVVGGRAAHHRDRPGPGGGGQRGGQGRRRGRARLGRRPGRRCCRSPAASIVAAASRATRRVRRFMTTSARCRAALASRTANDDLVAVVPGPGSVLSSSRTRPARSMTKAMSGWPIMEPGGQDLSARSRSPAIPAGAGGRCRSGTASSAPGSGVPGGRTPGCRRPGGRWGWRRPRPVRPAASRRRGAARPARNSWAISGQSLVHTGSRKVSSTTLPRRLARLTVRPCWSVSWKGLAGKFSGAVDAGDGLGQDRVGVRAGLGGGHRRRAEDDQPDRADGGDGADARRGGQCLAHARRAGPGLASSPPG